MNDHILTGAQLIDPSQDHLAESLVVRGGKFIAAETAQSPDVDVIDGSGKLALPPFIDLSHWFGQSDYRPPEAAADESAAAIQAGFGAVCLSTDSTVWQSIRSTHAKPDTDGIDAYLDYLPVAAMTSDLTKDCSDLLRHDIHDVCSGLYNPSDKKTLTAAFNAAARHGLTVHSYCLDSELGQNGCVHDGMTATRLGLHPIPIAAETRELNRLLNLVEQTGAKLHLKCVTSAAGVRAIEEAKDAGLPVTADTSIAHLFLTEHDITHFDSRCHVLPPLRSTEDRDALLDGIQMGVIDAVCSEHQPLNRDAKLAPFPSTEPGMSTLDVYLPLGLRLVQDEVLTLERWVELSHLNPARILGLNKPGFTPGGVASYILVDRDDDFECTIDSLLSSSPHCPFTGWHFSARVVQSCLKGRIAYRRDLD